ENTGRVGSTEISFGLSEPSCKVQTSGNWSLAFNEIIKATSFVFPHQETKLRKYSKYINREFSSKVDLSHQKIILYNTAVRNKVGGGQQMLLTNRNKFSFIYSTTVMPDGIESNYNKQSGSQPNGTKSQVDYYCRFNSGKGCPDDSKCRYKHICRKCKHQGHSQVNCDSKSRKNPGSTT
ncbi:hypothetical protein B0H34DRAFT_664675, partial [Crassisporium funariophilum]